MLCYFGNFGGSNPPLPTQHISKPPFPHPRRVTHATLVSSRRHPLRRRIFSLRQYIHVRSVAKTRPMRYHGSKTLYVPCNLLTLLSFENHTIHSITHNFLIVNTPLVLSQGLVGFSFAHRPCSFALQSTLFFKVEKYRDT